MMPKGGGGILPAEYQQVEYIKFVDNAWIDTGILPVDVGKWLLDAKVTNVQHGYCGCSNTNANRMIIGVVSSSYYLGRKSTAISADGMRHTFILDCINEKWHVDDASGNAIVDAPDFTLYLGQAHRSTNPGNYAALGEFYASKIWDLNGELVQDLIPCYRKSDNVGGMYDIVSNQFFVNAYSAGSIEVGPEIN